MGLSVALSNALSGLKIGQSSLDVISRNIANAGTPGYHARSVSVIDTLGVNSSYAREGTLTRAFNQSLQQHYTSASADSGFASIKANYLDRVQTLFGKPGTTGSLDSAFNDFQASLTSLATSPDNYATRADTVQKAQVLSDSLNRMSGDVQSLRQEVESDLSAGVDNINSMLSSLEKINGRLTDQGLDPNSRAGLLDQRDRLVGDLSNQMDLRVTYRSDDTVALMTRSGVGLLDGKASLLTFQSAGAISANSRFDFDDSKSTVGKLILSTPAGLSIDMVKENVLRSGELAGLIELRDTTLVQAQDQLDEVASSLAQSMSTVTTDGTAATGGGGATGYDIDLSGIRNGNDFMLSFVQGGMSKSVRVVRVDDTTKLPLDYQDANGVRVIGLDFSGGAASVANQVQQKLGTGLVVSNPSGSTLRILDDGAAGTTDVSSLVTRTTATGIQGGQLGLSLFTDLNNADFTNSLDGVGQKRGFASRISVNTAIVNDNKLLVQYQAGGSLGDAARVDKLVDQLNDMRFAGSPGKTGPSATFGLAGTVSDFISQTINYQGNAAATADADSETQTLTLSALGDRLDSEYGVDVDEEMSRLMEIQNAYAANARVIAAAQELINTLMEISL